MFALTGPLLVAAPVFVPSSSQVLPEYLTAFSFAVLVVPLSLFAALWAYGAVLQRKERRDRALETSVLIAFTAAVHAKYDVLDERIDKPTEPGTTEVLARVGGKVTPCELHVRNGSVFVFSRSTGVEADQVSSPDPNRPSHAPDVAQEYLDRLRTMSPSAELARAIDSVQFELSKTKNPEIA